MANSIDFDQIPFDDIVALGQRTMLYGQRFTVSWLLGRKCNYNCSYCWPYARSDTSDHRPTELLIKTMDEIKRQARQNSFNAFHFSFSGGEPTLHRGLLTLLEHYAADEDALYQSTHCTTNMSPGMRWWQKYIDATAKLHRVSITASWHREQGIKQGNLDEFKKSFADKLVFLQENGVFVTVNMVMVPEIFDELWDEAMYFNQRNINVTLKPQSNTSASAVVSGYTQEMLDKLHNDLPQQDFLKQHSKVTRPKPKLSPAQVEKSQGINVPDQSMQVELQDSSGKRWWIDQAERLNAFEFNRFKGWTCNSGYQSIIIREPDGNIKRSYSCWDKPLGNIETGFRLFDKPTPCISPSCVSSADSKIPKKKL